MKHIYNNMFELFCCICAANIFEVIFYFFLYHFPNSDQIHGKSIDDHDKKSMF